MRRSAQGIPHTPACRSRVEAAMAATPAGADRVRQSAERIGAHVARAQGREEGEQSSKRQRIATEGGSTEDIVNPVNLVPNPEVPEVSINQKMLDAPAAPRSAAQTRLRSTADDKDDQPNEEKIKGQQPTGTGIFCSMASNTTQRKQRKCGTANADGGHGG